MGKQLDAMNESLQLGALALGSFDGVHLGHRELVKAVVEASDGLKGGAGILTFSPHPREFFSPNTYSRIYSLEQNIKLMESLGGVEVFVKKFDLNCSELSATDFLDQIFTKLRFAVLVVGFDFKFGKNRAGSQGDLLKWCETNDIQLKIVPCKSLNNEKISSTRIKENLAFGEVGEAALLLGEDYFHEGLAERDQGLGGKMGSPTINLKLDPQTNILCGVYQTKIFVNGTWYKAVSNIGFRPTVSSEVNRMVLETHILDPGFNEEACGLMVKVVFKSFVRPEKKFNNIEELRAQIEADLKFVKSL